MNITLWHGGKDLEYSYKELRGSKSGKWEHGAGLYTTTHYDTARDYAKGRGNTYLVTLELDPDKNLYEKKITMESALNFISTYCKKSKIALLSSDLNNCLKRSGDLNFINLEVLQNLIINHEAIVNTKSYLLNEFIIESGVQYGLVPRFRGRDETVIVIYDRNIIKKVKPVLSKDVTNDMFEIELPPFNFKKILNEQEANELNNNNQKIKKHKP